MNIFYRLEDYRRETNESLPEYTRASSTLLLGLALVRVILASRTARKYVNTVLRKIARFPDEILCVWILSHGIQAPLRLTCDGATTSGESSSRKRALRALFVLRDSSASL